MNSGLARKQRLGWMGRRNRGLRALAPLLALGLLSGALLVDVDAAPEVGQPLSPDFSFTVEGNGTGGTIVVASSVGWGNQTAVADIEAALVQDCAEACRLDKRCLIFDHCGQQTGCNGTLPFMRYQECRLLASPCTAVPLAGAAGPFIVRSAGFPVRQEPPDLPGYTRLIGQGVNGSALQCEGSVLPGRCAFATVDAAVAACSQRDDCQSIVIYFNGTDGCSSPVALLEGAPAADGGFMSPSIGTLVKNGTDSGGGGNGGGGDSNASSSGGLSAGAIAGIAVGASVGAAALAAAVWLALRRPAGQPCTQEWCSSWCCSNTSTADDRKASKFGDSSKAAEEGWSSMTPTGSSGAAITGAGGVARGSSAVAGTSSSSGGMDGSGEQLPELAQHIKRCDAQLSSVGGDRRLSRPQPSLLSIDSLSSSLKDWVVEATDITFLRRPDGSLQDLGRGASGSVYKAVFRGEVVAAKDMEIGDSAESQHAFVQEAERLHTLRHAHVVTLYGVALSGTRGILLMEYCGGRDLYRALELKVAGSSQRLFGWNCRGRRIAYDIAKALNFLHSRAVVHMDVKSSNVLLTSNGTAKLADIGLARVQHGSFLSDLPNAVGTFAWVAPEVLMGGQRCTSKVDIFSFGVVLHEIITGERPVRGHLRAPRVPEECPQAVADLMMDCLKLDPAERPTAQEIMQRLRSAGGKGDGDEA